MNTFLFLIFLLHEGPLLPPPLVFCYSLPSESGSLGCPMSTATIVISTPLLMTCSPRSPSSWKEQVLEEDQLSGLPLE